MSWTGISHEDNFTSDRDVAFGLDLSRPFHFEGENSALFKAGAKYRDKNKSRDIEVTDMESEDDLLLANFLDQGFSFGNFLDGTYVPGDFFVDSELARRLIPGLEGEKNFEEDSGDFDAKERVAAGYLMAEINFGTRYTLTPGFRYEHTSANYTGYQVLFNEDGTTFLQTL